nr:zinc finger, CCHC-type [Tanacetum cinerariifolium]
MYAMTCTRHDIAFAMGKLSRYTSHPGTQHWQTIQRLLKYLNKTMDYKLIYTGYPLVLEGYTDASWISNSEDNSSASGWVFLLGGGAISLDFTKQTCITGSTMESEFVTLAAGGKEAEWLKNLFLKIPLCVKPIAPISIRCDSAAILAKAYSQMYNGKSRRLEVRQEVHVHTEVCRFVDKKEVRARVVDEEDVQERASMKGVSQCTSVDHVDKKSFVMDDPEFKAKVNEEEVRQEVHVHTEVCRFVDKKEVRARVVDEEDVQERASMKGVSQCTSVDHVDKDVGISKSMDVDQPSLDSVVKYVDGGNVKTIVVYFPINKKDSHWVLAELDITSGVVTFNDSLGGPSGGIETRHFWIEMRQSLEF